MRDEIGARQKAMKKIFEDLVLGGTINIGEKERLQLQTSCRLHRFEKDKSRKPVGRFRNFLYFRSKILTLY